MTSRSEHTSLKCFTQAVFYVKLYRVYTGCTQAVSPFTHRVCTLHRLYTGCKPFYIKVCVLHRLHKSVCFTQTT